MDKPRIVHVMGDAAGIGAELTSLLLDDEEIRRSAHIVVVGDLRLLLHGAQITKSSISSSNFVVVAQEEDVPLGFEGLYFLDLKNCDPATISAGTVQSSAGAAAIMNFRCALSLVKRGIVTAVNFSPFNKAAMQLVDSGYEDETEFVKQNLPFSGQASEFNILEGVCWNARVTSHVPLSRVPSLVTRDAVLTSLLLTHRSMCQAGFSAPRIAVAALNPHAGEGGLFGREEIDAIKPAVEDACRQGILCEGPFPSDTVFVRVKRGQFDAVLTLFHDQGQIAMKLLGFESGVTYLGGFPVPITTAAHGTAYDIAWRGEANPQAAKAAFSLAVKSSTPIQI